MNNQQEPIAQLQELDRQLPEGPWTVGEVSSSQADIMDAKGSWVGTIRKDFDEDDEPVVIRLRNMLPDAIASFASLRSELTIAGTMIVEIREEANQQRARAEAVEEKMAQSRVWQFTPPTPGRWRMKFLRSTGWPEHQIMEVEVTQFQTKSSDLVVIIPGQWANTSLPLDDEFFASAQWQRIDDSAD